GGQLHGGRWLPAQPEGRCSPVGRTWDREGHPRTCVRRHNGRRVEPREELSDFLRSRRGRLTPDELGLRSYGPRRVPGLRREELAQLAGVSVDYYTRLEQGRGVHPSRSVLDAIARALQLDQAEASHLCLLARPQSAPRRKPPPERVRPAIRLLFDRLDRVAALV